MTPSTDSAPLKGGAKSEPAEAPGMVEDLVDAMLNGGINRGLIVFANGCFVVLFIFLVVLAIVWGLNIHVMFMLALCTGLLFSINWCVEIVVLRSCINARDNVLACLRSICGLSVRKIAMN